MIDRSLRTELIQKFQQCGAENNSLTTLNSVVTSADQPLKLEANLASDKEPTTISANGKGEETCLDDVGDLFEK